MKAKIYSESWGVELKKDERRWLVNDVISCQSLILALWKGFASGAVSDPLNYIISQNSFSFHRRRLEHFHFSFSECSLFLSVLCARCMVLYNFLCFGAEKSIFIIPLLCFSTHKTFRFALLFFLEFFFRPFSSLLLRLLHIVFHSNAPSGGWRLAERENWKKMEIFLYENKSVIMPTENTPTEENSQKEEKLISKFFQTFARCLMFSSRVVASMVERRASHRLKSLLTLLWQRLSAGPRGERIFN